MKLKNIILKIDQDLSKIYTQISGLNTPDNMEDLAEQLTNFDNVLYDYLWYYTDEEIDIEEVEDLDILEEYREQEQTLIDQLLYEFYLYIYCTFINNKDSFYQAYKGEVQNIFWETLYLVIFEEELPRDFYDWLYWQGSKCDFFENKFVLGPISFKKTIIEEFKREKSEINDNFKIKNDNNEAQDEDDVIKDSDLQEILDWMKQYF